MSFVFNNNIRCRSIVNINIRILASSNNVILIAKEVTINIKPKKCLFACLNSMQGSVQVEKDKNKK